MSTAEQRDQRARRARGIRDTWRKDEGAAQQAAAPESPDGRDDRRTESLGSMDRIRAEAPDDLETRRAADQLEREIKKSRKRRE